MHGRFGFVRPHEEHNLRALNGADPEIDTGIGKVTQEFSGLGLPAKMPDEDIGIQIRPHGLALVTLQGFPEGRTDFFHSRRRGFFSGPRAKGLGPNIGLIPGIELTCVFRIASSRKRFFVIPALRVILSISTMTS